MPCAPGVMSGSAKVAVKSGASAGPMVSCDAPAALRGLVEMRSAGMQLALKACGAACRGQQSVNKEVSDERA